MDKIVLKNMSFYAYHGVLPEEQQAGQNFLIDVEMLCDLRKACESDNLEDTVDYSGVYEIIENINKTNKFRLIERLADKISREILSVYEEVEKITVRVMKPQAPIGGKLDWAGVEVVRSRDGT